MFDQLRAHRQALQRRKHGPARLGKGRPTSVIRLLRASHTCSELRPKAPLERTDFEIESCDLTFDASASGRDFGCARLRRIARLAQLLELRCKRLRLALKFG